MYNPFPLLTPGLLRDQVAKGKRFFVRQTFPRGCDARLKAAFLLRAYEAIDQRTAEQHLAVLTRRPVRGSPGEGGSPGGGGSPDPHAYLYDVTIPDHLVRLKTAATQPFGYKVFYAAKKGVDWTPPEIYREKMRHYINRNHPDWRGTQGREPVEIGLYEEFGELFLKFSHRDKHDTIPFDLIETY
ncbi:MAG TPA: hypothetical protein VMH27_20065 [Puia sp.]|nr:hypothetical protein [Puia sp.]